MIICTVFKANYVTMKSVLSFLLLLHLCASIGYAQNSISGELENLPPGNLQLIIEEDINRKQSRLIAEIPVDEKGRFHYKAKLSPHIYSLKLNDNASIMLAIDKGQMIVISGNGVNANSWKVTGSDDTKILMDYEVFRKSSLDRLVNSVRKNIRDLKQKGIPDTDSSVARLTEIEVVNYNLHRDELMDYIKTHMGTSLAVYPTSIRWSGGKNMPFLAQLAKEFERAHPRSEIAAKINEKVKILQANSVGGKVAEIKMPDKDGVIVPLSSVHAKYILIDFWASWCQPCRKESHLLSDLYARFKPEGFEIYGVGMDASKETWLKAIEKDGRSWINVSTFQGFNTAVAFDYAVSSLPTNVLFDRSGKVIARNLHGDELKNMIEKLF